MRAMDGTGHHSRDILNPEAWLLNKNYRNTLKFFYFSLPDS